MAFDQPPSSNVSLFLTAKLNVNAIELIFHFVDFLVGKLFIIIKETKHVLLEVKIGRIVVDADVVASLPGSRVQRHIIIQIGFD